MSVNIIRSHTTAEEENFRSSPFSIQLVDSYSALLEVLKKVENLQKKIIAVDFEGTFLFLGKPIMSTSENLRTSSFVCSLPDPSFYSTRKAAATS